VRAIVKASVVFLAAENAKQQAYERGVARDAGDPNRATIQAIHSLDIFLLLGARFFWQVPHGLSELIYECAAQS